MTNEEFWSHCEWEGGVYEYVIDYGMDPEDLEDEQVRELVTRYKAMGMELDAIGSEIIGLVGE